jgi:hypothetical protein
MGLYETQLATSEQTKEIAGLVTDTCRNPDFEASTGIETHIVMFSTSICQLRAATRLNPFKSEGPVDCGVTTREQVDEVGEFSQLILESDFLFTSSGLLRRRFSGRARRYYATLDHDKRLLVPVSQRALIPFDTPKEELKRLEERRKEVDRLTKAVHPPEFLQSDYEKLLTALAQFSLEAVIKSGEDASEYNHSSDARWQG